MAELLAHSLQQQKDQNNLHLTKNYESILNNLVAHELRDEGVTVFRGGPLDLRHFGVDNAWLTPLLVRDAAGYSAFQAIHLNALQTDATEVELSLAGDLSLKLEDTVNEEKQRLDDLIQNSNGAPKTIIRPSVAGNIAFPHVSLPSELPPEDRFLSRIAKAFGVFGKELPKNIDVRRFLAYERFRPATKVGSFVMGYPRIIHGEAGDIYSYGVLAGNNDPWKYYEILAPYNLGEIDIGAEMNVRVDSGCDIGECYHDGGCDCKFQLQTALEKAREQMGIIVHIPTQDGRGYGMAVKMATEGGKRGIDVGYNHEMPSMDTITSARTLLGEEYDIRTYEGAAALLVTMGFHNINLITDSRVKLEALHQAGLNVMRIPTGTQNGNHHAHEHVHAKHTNGNGYYGD